MKVIIAGSIAFFACVGILYVAIYLYNIYVKRQWNKMLDTYFKDDDESYR